MTNRSSLLVSLFLGVLSAVPLPAQLSRARSAFEKLRSLVSEIQPDRDESRLESTANSIQEAASSVSENLTELGRGLAGFSGPFGSERSAVYEGAGVVRKSFGTLGKLGKDLIEHLKSKSRWSTVDEYKRELALRCQDVRMEFERDAKEWEALTRKIEETKRWLQDRLKEAAAMRDNAAKPAEALEQAEDQILARQQSLDDQFKNAFSAWTKAVDNSYRAAARETETSRRWQESIKAADGNQFSEKVKALANTWASAYEEHREAQRVRWEAFMNLQSVSEEQKRIGNDLGRAMQELRAFAKDATNDTINKRWADFDLWARGFEYNVSQ